MSADDFQTKYSSVMESMLKSAVAETTKLFEAMVNELKAEISKLKTENDDLRTKYKQLNKANGQVSVNTRPCESLKGLNDSFEKRDTATQCDLAPVRTMVVEQCEPLSDLSLQNQKKQWLYEDMNYGLQEHDYVSHRNAHSHMAYIQVKQEAADDFPLQSILKEEVAEPSLDCRRDVSDKVSEPTSACGTEGQKGLHINQESSSDDISLPPTVALKLPSLEIASGSHIKNQSSKLGCSKVISLATIKDDLEEETDTNIKISEIRSAEYSLVVAQQTIEKEHCQREGGMSVNDQTGVTVQPYHSVQHIEEQFAKPTPCDQDIADGALKLATVAGKSSPERICRKKGRPPLKRVRILQLPSTRNEQRMVTCPLIRLAEDNASSVVDTVNTTASVSPKVSSIKSKTISSITNRAAQQKVNTASSGDVDAWKVGSLPGSEISLEKGSSTNKDKTKQSLKPSIEITEAEIQPPPKNDMFATRTNTLQTQPQPSHRCTSVTIQDAMLLVEAMNQSTAENASPFSGPLVSKLLTVNEIPAKSPMPRPVLVGTLPVTTLSTSKLSKGEKPKAAIKSHSQLGGVRSSPQHVVTSLSTTTLSIPLYKTATQTTSGLHQMHPLSVPSNPNATMQKIIIVPKSTSLMMPHKIATLSSNQPTVVTTVRCNTGLHTASTTEAHSLSCVPPQTIYVTQGQLLPIVSSKSNVIFTDQQEGSLTNSEVRITTPSQSQTIVLASKQDTATSSSTNSTAVASQPSSSSQELKESLNTQTSHEVDTASQNTETSDNLESPKQTTAVPETADVLLETCSSLNRPLGHASPSTFPVKPMVQQKFSAMVRLTRLPFSLSTEDSVLVSKLIFDGSSEPQFALKDITTQKQPSETQQFTTASVSAPAINMTEPSDVLFPEKDKDKISNTVQHCMSTASLQLTTFTSKDASDPHLQMTKTQFLAQLEVSPRVEDPEKVSPNELPDSTVCSKKRLNKASLLACLRRRPEVNTEPCKEAEASNVDPKEVSSKTGGPDGNVTEPFPPSPENESLGVHIDIDIDSLNNTNKASLIRFDQCEDLSSEKSLCEHNTSYSIYNDATKPKNTKSTSPSPGRNRTTRAACSPKNTQSTSLSPRRGSTTRDGCSPKNTKFTSSSPRRSSTTRDDSSPKNRTPTSLTTRRKSTARDDSSPKNTKPTSLTTRRKSTTRDGPSPKNTNSTSLSPRRSSTTRDASSPKNRKSASMSPRRTSTIKEISKNTKLIHRPSTFGDVASPKMAKSAFSSPKSPILSRDDTSPKIANATPVSPKRTNSARGESCPQKTKTEPVTPRMSKSTRELMIGDNRRSFTKGNANTQQTKSKSNSFSPRRFSITTGGALSKKAKSETASPSIRSLGKRNVSPATTRESTPAKKERLSQDLSGSKTSLRLLKKLAKPAKAKTITKMNISHQQKLQSESKTSQVTEKQTNNDAVKKITCKAVWTPPKMPVTKTSKEEIKSQDVQAVYLHDNSAHSIPVRAPPMVSPLQPLMVIGGHLLKNQCGECGRMLSSSAALESHVRLHKGRRPFSCTLCGKSFPDSKGLKRHGRVHRNGRIHVCPQCGKGFVYRFGLSKHLQMVHGRLKPFVCQICNKGFYTKRDVESHIRIHTGEKPFHCNLCEKKFSRRVELNVHLRWHNGEKRHWCPYCGKGFLDYNNLKRHKFIHTGERPHSCPHCTKRFTQSAHLKKHVKNVHKIE